MEIIKKYKGLLILALVALAGLFFFYRLHRHDVKSLVNFSVAYKNFDKAISDFSIPVFAPNFEGAPATDDLERKADEALVELNTKASARLSSLIKNDAELMSTTLEIADLSGKELDALKAYKRAVADKNVNLDRLAKEFGDLTNKRQSAYARFQELAGLKD
jgi:hypothetical protein